MSDNKEPAYSEEESLGSLISSAIEKKHSAANKNEYAQEREMTLEERIAAAKRNRENGVRPPLRNDDPTAGRTESGSAQSIEAMVANAMNNRSSSGRNEEHFVSEADIASDEEYQEEEEDSGFLQRAKAFFVQHKLKFMIAALVLVVIVLIALVIFIIVFNHYYNRVGREDSRIVLQNIDSIDDSDTVSDVLDYEKYLQDQLKDYANILGSEDVYNILLVGEDLRDTEGQSRGNTDVMLLVSINRKTEQITLTSFMRDIYLYIPGYYSTRLNAAYATGGAQLLGETIERNFGIQIDNYVIVNFYTFIEIIDTIGGIDVEITQAMVDALYGPMSEQNRYLGNPPGTDYINKPGNYHLNGNQALGYVRIRHGVGNDFGRTARQREVISMMIEKARGMSLSEMKELLDKVTAGDNVKWDLEKEEVLSLLTNAYDYYKNYDVQELQIPVNGTYTDQRIRGAQVLCPDFDKNTEILQMTIYGETIVKPEQTSTYPLPQSPDTYVYTTKAPSTEPPYVEPVTTPVTTIASETTAPPPVVTDPPVTTPVTTAPSETTTTAPPPETTTTEVSQSVTESVTDVTDPPPETTAAAEPAA